MDKDKERKIVNEILNDAFWLGYILEIKKNISDYEKKEVLSSFLVFFSSIFVEETIKAKYGGLSGKRKITLKEIEYFRNHNLKYCPSNTSLTTNEIINEMGIDFDNYIFDVVLYLNNKNLLDINFRNWEYSKEEKFELIDGIVATPLRWIEILMPDIYDIIKEKLKDISNMYVERISKTNINRKSYSTYKLFSKSKINKEEKLYILQRYGLVKTILFIDNIIKEKISFDIGIFHFDLQRFIAKAKAIIIEMFWNDKKSNSSINLLEEVFKQNEKNIDKKFYSINRKCRNNLHYSDFHNISEKENKILIMYQEIYLKNILEIFNRSISYNFGISYRIGLSLAKLEYWSRT